MFSLDAGSARAPTQGAGPHKHYDGGTRNLTVWRQRLSARSLVPAVYTAPGLSTPMRDTDQRVTALRRDFVVMDSSSDRAWSRSPAIRVTRLRSVAQSAL